MVATLILQTAFDSSKAPRQDMRKAEFDYLLVRTTLLVFRTVANSKFEESMTPLVLLRLYDIASHKSLPVCFAKYNVDFKKC